MKSFWSGFTSVFDIDKEELGVIAGIMAVIFIIGVLIIGCVALFGGFQVHE